MVNLLQKPFSDLANGSLVCKLQFLSSLRHHLPTTSSNGVPEAGPGKLPFKSTHIADLDGVVARHFQSTKAPALAISGRYHPLVYKIASTLVSPPHQFALLIIDLDGRLDATRLCCDEEDARHVYVQRPSQQAAGSASHAAAHGESSVDVNEHVKLLLAGAENFMFYSAAAAGSGTRQWWGTILVGSVGLCDIAAGWKGWLRVDREQVPAFPLGFSIEKALGRRDARQAAADEAGWSTDSQWGGFVFQEEHLP
jgi:hypothetical protein